MARKRTGIERIRFVSDIPNITLTPREADQRQIDQEEFLIWKAKYGLGTGTYPEFLVFRELVRRGLKYGTDFEYQSNQLGGREKLGGAVVDFILYSTIAGRVQGEYFHFTTQVEKLINIIQRRMLENRGFLVVDMLATEIENNPKGIVALFINGQETAGARETVQ